MKNQIAQLYKECGGDDLTPKMLQHALSFETPQEVKAEVRRIIDCMTKGGGYVLVAAHNFQREVPPENIVAIFEEGRSYWHSHQD